MFSGPCIFLFLVMIMAPFHPINSMSYNYCLKEKNIGEIKQTNKQWIFCLLDPVLRLGHTNRSWRIAKDLGWIFQQSKWRVWRGKEDRRSCCEQRGQGTRTREADLSDLADRRGICIQDLSRFYLNNYMVSTVPESNAEAKKSPTNQHMSIPGSLVHCLCPYGKLIIVPIGIKEGFPPVLEKLSSIRVIPICAQRCCPQN